MINNVNLLQLVEKLPLQAQIELQDFAEFLTDKYVLTQKVEPTYLQMYWSGVLHDYNQQFTSLELQKQALQWRENYVFD